MCNFMGYFKLLFAKEEGFIKRDIFIHHTFSFSSHSWLDI